MPDIFDIFPSRIKNKLFETDRGDLCVCLREAWPSLLADLALLGPVVLISRSEQIVLVSYRARLEFLPVPGSTEMIEEESGFGLEMAELGAVIAGREVQTGNLSLHFFGLKGGTLLKVLLAPGADLEGFSKLVERYAKAPECPFKEAPGCVRVATREGAVLAEDRNHFQEAWSSFDPRLGGDFLPGGRGVSWWDAFCLAGRKRALFLTKIGLVKAILAAHQDRLRLRITTWQGGLHHEATLVPRRLERCGHCLHLFDLTTEAHVYLEAEMNIWAGFHGEDCAPAIHLFAPGGERRGLIEFEGAGDALKDVVDEFSA
jgi:putative heme degradation protein